MLLEKASSEVRARLSAENPQAGTAIEGVVAEVVGGIRTEVRNASPDFAAAQAAVERQNRIRRIGEAEIYQYARERKFEETAIALSIMCDTPIDVVERALLDPGAEIVLILAKVAACPRPRPKPSCCCARPTAACRRRTSTRRCRASTDCNPTPPGACSASSAPASKSRWNRLPRRPSPSTADANLSPPACAALSKSNSPAALAATSRSDSGNSSRRATSNNRWPAAALPTAITAPAVAPITAPATAPPAPRPMAPPRIPPTAPPTMAPASGSCAAAGCAGINAARSKISQPPKCTHIALPSSLRPGADCKTRRRTAFQCIIEYSRAKVRLRAAPRRTGARSRHSKPRNPADRISALPRQPRARRARCSLVRFDGIYPRALSAAKTRRERRIDSRACRGVTER